jgi:hypothetical protein
MNYFMFGWVCADASRESMCTIQPGEDGKNLKHSQLILYFLAIVMSWHGKLCVSRFLHQVVGVIGTAYSEFPTWPMIVHTTWCSESVMLDEDDSDWPHSNLTTCTLTSRNKCAKASAWLSYFRFASTNCQKKKNELRATAELLVRKNSKAEFATKGGDHRKIRPKLQQNSTSQHGSSITWRSTKIKPRRIDQ